MKNAEHEATTCLKNPRKKKARIFSSHFLENSAKAGCTCSVLGHFTGKSLFSSFCP
ncbi:hypothetical protein HMPREF0542_12071 [Ligilactobacillus ruminis ATCC 25644]|uniref:Uncharacterized protein n=1 Tax=Ligilactobacillus ruminis ATCC 25644 TaxID=525362 RepID=E7FT44_9LACO|nr:hypothetical protein HMPREF0542_12071 [Ligilactobacillus ruminis ATCC 25644]